MNTENSSQMTEQQLWLYLTGSGNDVQQHGPFDVETMKVLFTQNYITENALVWTSGMDGWQQLKTCHEIYEQMVFPDQEKGKPPRKKKKKTTDADLAEFEAEIAAIEDGHADEGTPPPEEKTFVDDDGTKFVWDAALRKFRPDDMAVPPPASEQSEQQTQPPVAPAAGSAAAAEYTQDMMTFGGIEETVVTLDEAREEQEAELQQVQVMQEPGDAAAGPPHSSMGPPPAAPVGSTPQPAEAVRDSAALREGDGAQLAAGSDDGVGVHAGTSATAAAQASKPAASTAAASTAAAAGSGSKKSNNNNTSVYVMGIPEDATEDEVAEEFSKCGIIKLDADGNPRVKLYTDKETGMRKGDALITFLQRPSVSLACTLMHERALRPLRGGRPMSVQQAQFEPKGDQAATAAAPGAGKEGQASNTKKGAKGGPGAKGKGKKGPSQIDKVLGWGGFDDRQKASEVTVVFLNLFTLEDMTLSPDLEGLLSEYIIHRCKDLGAIERVRVFRKTASGVVTARFRVPDDAQTAIQRFSGTAVIWGMFAAKEMCARGTERAAEVEEDVVERAASLGVRLVGEGGLRVIYGQSGNGMVAVGCADVAGMQRLLLGFDEQSYDGRTLQAEAVEAFLWDGETKPESYGAAAMTAPSEEARLEAYAASLEQHN